MCLYLVITKIDIGLKISHKRYQNSMLTRNKIIVRIIVEFLKLGEWKNCFTFQGFSGTFSLSQDIKSD